MDIPEPHLDPLTPTAARCLARGLDALSAWTEAPLRVRVHATSRDCEIFDLVEEPELGEVGRRFLVSVERRPRARSAMLVAART